MTAPSKSIKYEQTERCSLEQVFWNSFSLPQTLCNEIFLSFRRFTSAMVQLFPFQTKRYQACKGLLKILFFEKLNQYLTDWIKKSQLCLLQRSILDPLLFNTYLNNLFIYLRNSDLHNLLTTVLLLLLVKKFMIFCALQKKRLKEQVINWFNNNHIIANPDKISSHFSQQN